MRKWKHWPILAGLLGLLGVLASITGLLDYFYSDSDQSEDAGQEYVVATEPIEARLVDLEKTIDARFLDLQQSIDSRVKGIDKLREMMIRLNQSMEKMEKGNTLAANLEETDAFALLIKQFISLLSPQSELVKELQDQIKSRELLLRQLRNKGSDPKQTGELRERLAQTTDKLSVECEEGYEMIETFRQTTKTLSKGLEQLEESKELWVSQVRLKDYRASSQAWSELLEHRRGIMEQITPLIERVLFTENPLLLKKSKSNLVPDIPSF